MKAAMLQAQLDVRRLTHELSYLDEEEQLKLLERKKRHTVLQMELLAAQHALCVREAFIEKYGKPENSTYVRMEAGARMDSIRNSLCDVGPDQAGEDTVSPSTAPSMPSPNGRTLDDILNSVVSAITSVESPTTSRHSDEEEEESILVEADTKDPIIPTNDDGTKEVVINVGFNSVTKKFAAYNDNSNQSQQADPPQEAPHNRLRFHPGTGWDDVTTAT